MRTFSKNPYGRKRDGGVAHQDPTAAQQQSMAMIAGVESVGGADHMLPSTQTVVPLQQAAV